MPPYYQPRRTWADELTQGLTQGLGIARTLQQMRESGQEMDLKRESFDFQRQQARDQQRDKTVEQDRQETEMGNLQQHREGIRKNTLMDNLRQFAPENPEAATSIWNKEFAPEYGAATFLGKKYTKYTDPDTNQEYEGEAFNWSLQKAEGGEIQQMGLLKTRDGQVVSMRLPTGVTAAAKEATPRTPTQEKLDQARLGEVTARTSRINEARKLTNDPKATKERLSTMMSVMLRDRESTTDPDRRQNIDTILGDLESQIGALAKGGTGAAPAGLPAGSKLVGSQNGKPVYLTPGGKRIVQQ